MKKRLLSLAVLLALLLSLSVAVCAEQEQFVFDSAGKLSGDELESLNALGARIYADTGCAVCVCLSDDTGENAADFARQFYTDEIGETDGIVLVHNTAENLISYAASGKLSALDEEQLNELLDAYNGATTHFYAVHDFMILVYARLQGSTAVGTVTPEDNANIPAERQLDRVVDLAGVLDAETLTRLNSLADTVSDSYQCDVAVAFVDSLGGKYVVDYADDFYDYNGYGYGMNDDGILLLVSVGDREYAETTYGYGTTAFTDYGLSNYLEPRFVGYLGRDDWAGAAQSFITGAGELLRRARDGEIYDNYGTTPQPQQQTSTGQKVGFAAVISAVIGFFSGGIPTGSMKRSMKSVEKNYGAANYARGGLNLRRNEDRFLYANVHKTPIPRESEHRSSGGGSSVHFSSSGRTHGGSHGKF